MNPNDKPDPSQQSGSKQEPTDALVQDALDPNPLGFDSEDIDYAKMARDPVCGRLVSKATATETLPAPVNDAGEGLVYFDSPECKALYEEDPAKYGSSF
jgi:YHS domain-containing protein